MQNWGKQMKRIKRCWQIFVLFFIFSFTAVIFISCGPNTNANTVEDTTVENNSTTTTPTKPTPPTENETPAENETPTPPEPTPPAETETPTEPTGPDVPPHEHVYGNWEVDTAATCTEPEVEKRTCECGEYETRTVGETLAHYCPNPEEQPATCTTAGYVKYTCAYCNEIYQIVEIPAKEHDYEDTVIDPTCNQEGYTLHQCKDCGYEEKTDFTAATGETGPIKNLTDTYWYLDDGNIAIHFTFDETTNQTTYSTYRYNLSETGTLTIGKASIYSGTYELIESTADGATEYTVKLYDNYCKETEGYKPYYISKLKYSTKEDGTTGKTIYTLKGNVIAYGEGTLIYAEDVVYWNDEH